jgi:predicted Holliday junction resolvase-like endonuclease
MATIMFALGVLTMVMVILITVTVVGAVKVVKMQKQLKELQLYISERERNINDWLRDMSRETDQRFHEMHRNSEHRFEEISRDINMVDQTMQNGLKNTKSYTDSRIDKLVDTYFQVKAAEQQEKELIKG